MRRRGRKSRRRRSPAPDSGLAAFSDIAFLLIIFFISIANLNKHQGMITDIPAAQEGEESEDEMPTVLLDGRSILLNDKPVGSFDELMTKLASLELSLKQNPEDRIVQLEAKDDVAYQDYFQAMTTIAKAGGQITIVQREGEGDGKGGGG